MRFMPVGVVVAVAALSGGLFVPAGAGPSRITSDTTTSKPLDLRAPHVEGEVVVTFKQATTTAALTSSGYKVQRLDRRRQLVKVASGGIAAAVTKLRARADVASAEPNWIRQSFVTPNDTRFAELWGMAKISAPQAWNTGTGSRSVVVAVSDTGIDAAHPDLAANLWNSPGLLGCAAGTHGWDAISNDCVPQDDQGHGSHVSGTIGAVGNNATGVAGLSWQTSLMGVKVLNSQGSGTDAQIIAGLDFVLKARQAGVNVRAVNASWGGGPSSASMRAKIQELGNAGVLFIAAAGNDSRTVYKDGAAQTARSYPCSYALDNLICVASTAENDTLSFFSTRGPAADIAAPGSNILSTTNGGYASLSGTSMATPHVTGLAGLLASIGTCTNASVATLKSAIVDTFDAVGIAVRTGGRINASRAVAACAPPGPTTTTTPPGPTTTGPSTTAGPTTTQAPTTTAAPTTTTTTPPVGIGTLVNGVPVTGLSGAAGSTRFWQLVVPAGQTTLTFRISGGTGDADMYVRRGAQPTTSTYDCRPYLSGNNETCTFNSPVAATYYVMLRGYTAFSGVTLTGTYSAGSTTPVLVNGVAVSGISGTTGSTKYWQMTVPAGVSALSFQTAGGTGDADLYVRRGALPTTTAYDCRPYRTGNTETCSFSAPVAGTYYVMVRGYTTYSGVTLVGVYL